MNKLQSLVFLGASTAFSEISGIIYDINKVKERYKIIAVLDDDEKLHGKKLENIPIVGNLELVHNYPDTQFIFGIGSFRTRLVRYSIIKRLNLPDERFVTLIHPGAKVYNTANIQPGCIINYGSVISSDVALQPFTIVVFNSVIAPNCNIGWGAMITSSVVVLSNVQIGPCAFIGAGSCLAERVKIGPGAMVGIGSVVSGDVTPGAFVVGNPARVINKVDVPPELLIEWNSEK